MRSADPDYGRPQPELWYDTRDRCRMAAQLYHDGFPCLVVAAGGPKASDPTGPPLAQAMKQYLLEHGVEEAMILIEDRSQSTYENALFTTPILRDHDVSRIAAVTDGIHLWRAEYCFRAQGFDVLACGAYYRATELELSLLEVLPSAAAAQDMKRVLHEWLGSGWYWLRGRI